MILNIGNRKTSNPFTMQNDLTKQRQLITERFQDECHEWVDRLREINGEKIDVESAVNVWMYSKLAEIEIRLQSIESFLQL
jgi:hypothetical protein